MINLAEIKTTKILYKDLKSDLLIVGLHEDKHLNTQQRSLDEAIENQISKAMALDQFTGKKDSQISLYGNESLSNYLDNGTPSDEIEAGKYLFNFLAKEKKDIEKFIKKSSKYFLYD